MELSAIATAASTPKVWVSTRLHCKGLRSIRASLYAFISCSSHSPPPSDREEGGLCLFRSLCSATGSGSCPLAIQMLQKDDAAHTVQTVGTRVHWGIKQSWHPRMPIHRSADRHIGLRSGEGLPTFGMTRLGLWERPQHPECGFAPTDAHERGSEWGWGVGAAG